ncbi:MAG TPA: FkbM family methyltransferase [Gaiellaceae bacterium]|nr:FkbM family methyltransferase [Gaiellaceae bacterium]
MTRALARAALRLPGRVVPGWFPLVVEPLHARVAPAASEVEADVHGSRMLLRLDDYTQRKIYYRAFEEAEARLYARLLRPGDVAVDVGANVGYFTLLFARLVGEEGFVVAVEPVLPNLDRLRRNLGLNGCGNVAVEAVAAGARSGTLRLGLPAAAAAGVPESGWYSVSGGGAAVDVAVAPLDDLLEHRIPGRRLRLVKVDVEGMEPEVLEGLARTLAERPPDAVSLEVGRDLLAARALSADDALRPLLRHGYRLHRVGVGGRLRHFAPPRPWWPPDAVATVVALR